MQEIHLEGRQRIKSQEMAFTGLFAALIAAGAYMRIDIPVQPFPMHFTLQFFFCASGRLCAGGQTGSCLCVRLPGSGIGGDSRICSRRRAGVSDPSYLWFFDRLCGCGLDYRKAVLEASGGRGGLAAFFCLLGHDGVLSVRNGIFLCDQ